MAAIKRTGSNSGARADLVLLQQQKYAGMGGLHFRQDSAAAVISSGPGKPHSMSENNAGIFNQPALLPLPVQIPDPYANSASAFYGQAPPIQRHSSQLQNQQQPQQFDMALSQKADYLQQQKHQPSGSVKYGGVNQKHSPAMSNQTGPTSVVTRLPKQQHQQPTSKMVPKSLNDIYEKHLLSQTQFDSGGGSGPSNILAPKETTTVHRMKSSLATTIISGQQAPPSNQTNKLSKDHNSPVNLYESIRGNYHIYEKIDPTTSGSSAAAPPPKCNSRLEHYVRPPPPLQPRPKSLPVGASLPSTVQRNQAPSSNSNNNNIPFKLTSPDMLRTMKSPIGSGPGLSPISEKPLFSSIPVYGGGAAHKSVITADKINIALETAKALATAAYIER